MKSMLKRQRHPRSNNRMNRNYHQNPRHNNNDALVEEHMKDSERLDYRPARSRVTLQQYVEKYTAQARDAASSGDRILSENYLQHADHFSRLLNEQTQIRQQIEQRKQQKEQAIINDIGTVGAQLDEPAVPLKGNDSKHEITLQERNVEEVFVAESQENIRKDEIQKPKRKIVRKKKVEKEEAAE